MSEECEEFLLRNHDIDSLLQEREDYLEQIRILKTQLLQAGITPFSPHTTSAPDLTGPSKRYSLPILCGSGSQTHIKPKRLNSCFSSQCLSTYDKRSGTNDLGKQYEYTMCGYYAIRFATSSKVSDFEMTTNNEIYGDFDDIVLKVKYVDHTSHTYVLQLKHTENKKGLTEKNLAAENKDFSMMKYLKTFQNLSEKDNLTCILFTNRTAHFKESLQFPMNNVKLVVKPHHEVKYEELLDTNQTSKKSVFQFDVSDDFQMDEMNCFLNNFYLFANQNNVAKMKTLITELLKQILKCDVYETFIHFMKNWWCGNFVLNKKDVISKLAELALSPSIRTISDQNANAKTELLKDAILKFDMTLVEGFDSDVVSHIWTTTEDVREVSLTALKYGLTNKGISNLEELTLDQRCKALWYLNKVPLILKVYASKKEQVKSAVKLLQLLNVKKKLLISGEFQREDFGDWNVFESLLDLKSDSSYDEILKEFQLSLQGRDAISLQTLIDSPDKSKIIKVKELLLMTQKPLLIGEEHVELPESYIPRTVSTNFLNTERVIMHCVHSQELAVIKCEPQFCDFLETKSFPFTRLGDYARDSDCSILVAEKCTKSDFDEVCAKTTKRRVHFLRTLTNECSILVLSSDNNLKSDDFRYQRAPIEEEEIHQSFDNPINVLCAQPGIGKSTMIKFLYNNCPSDYYSVRVNLRKFNCLLKEEPEEDEILLYFLGLDGLGQNSLLEQVKRVFFENRKIYLFLDGLDEIESNCVDFALQYVNYIASTGVHVWISSRQNLQEVITTRLNIFPIDIRELNREEQKKYIEQRLEARYEIEEIERISNEIFHSANVANCHNMLGIPLQLYIITENFLDDVDLYHTLSEEVFVLTKMYDIFFDGKKKHLYEKVGVQYEQQLGFNFHQYLENYEIPALKCCLDDTAFQRLNLEDTKNQEFLEMVKTEGDKFGIISQINEDRAVFIHQTYAEYFACLWLKKNFSKARLLKDEFKTEKYQNLKLIFDIMLAENCPLHLAVIYRNIDQVRKHLSNVAARDEGGRSALHLICSYGSKYVPLQIAPSLYTNHLFHDENGFSGENQVYQEIFTILAQCDPFETDEVFQWNSLDYSFHFTCLYPVEKFLQQYEDKVKVDVLLQRLNSVSLVYYAAKLGYPNLLEAVIKRNRTVLHFKIGEDKLSFLHVAVRGVAEDADTPFVKDEVKIEIINILIKNGIDINTRDSKGATALHLAVTEARYGIVKALLDVGADINALSFKEETIVHYVLEEWKNQLTLYNIDQNQYDFTAKDRDGTTLLHWACKEGDLDLTRTLLKKGVDVNERNRIGENALHYAVRAWKPNLEIIKSLINSGIDINCSDTFGISPLHWAFDKGHYDVIGILHQKGANVTTITPEHKTTLKNCYKPLKPNMYIMEMLMDYGFNVNSRTSDGISILHWVSEKGHEGMTKLLIANGANINATTKINETILHYAARGWNTKLIRMFTEIGSDVNARDENGVTAFHRAAERGHVDMVTVLADQGAKMSATTNHGESILTFAVKIHEPQIQVVKYLISNGIDVNGQDHDGISALHWACERGHYKIVKLLLDQGASVNAKTRKGETPLHYTNSNPQMIECLLENGVNVNATDVNGMTALHWASERGQFDLVKILLDSGADVNATTAEEETVLIYAMKQRKVNIELIKLLVTSGGDISAIDKNGMNALHWASENGHYDVVKLLLNSGIDVHFCTNKNESTLHCASKSWKPNTEIIKKLVCSGVDINGRDGDGKTPLHWAAKEAHYTNVEFLINLGADIHSKTNNEETTLHFAARAWKINDSVLELLLDRGVDVNLVDKEGKSALHWASEKGFYDNVQLLLDRGALVDDVTKNNLTALHYAVYGGHVRIIKLLLSRGLSIGKIETRNVNLPLYFAERNGNLKEELLVMMAATIHDKFPLLLWKRYSYTEVITYLQEAQPYMEPLPVPRHLSTTMSEHRNSFLSSCQSFAVDNVGHSVAWLRNFFNGLSCKKTIDEPRTPTFIVHYPVFPSDDACELQEVKTPTIDRSYTF